MGGLKPNSMKTLTELESQISNLYARFFNEVGIDKEKGIVQGTSYIFQGAPFIGSLYPNVKKKILIVGLDIGSDEGMHTFDSRRQIISHSANGLSEIPAKKPFNAHFAGTYALVFALLHDTIEKKESWQKFSSDDKETAYKAIQKHHSEIPVELLDYICFTNAHKFVTIDRKNKGGGQDRKWNKVVPMEKELSLLKNEIAVFQPNIIVFQSPEFKSIVPILDIDSNIRTLVTYHPAYRDRFHRSIGYIKEMANELYPTL